MRSFTRWPPSSRGPGRVRRRPGASRGAEPLQAQEEQVGGDRQDHAEHRGGEHLGAEVGVEAVEDEGAETAVVDDGADRGEGDGGDGGDPHPGQQRGQRQRHLDLPQEPPRPVPHAGGRLAGLLGDGVEPREGVPHQDRQRVEHQPGDHQRRREAEEREQQGEHGERGDRVEERGHREDRGREGAPAVGEDRQREGDQHADDDGGHCDPDVLEGRVDQVLAARTEVLPADPVVGHQAVRCAHPARLPRIPPFTPLFGGPVYDRVHPARPFLTGPPKPPETHPYRTGVHDCLRP